MLTWESIRNTLHNLALERGEIAGYPMPIEGHELRVAKGVNFSHLEGARLDSPESEWVCSKDDLAWVERTSWWCAKRRARIIICQRQRADGSLELDWCADPPFGVELEPLRRFYFLQQTLDAGIKAWDFDAEARAVETLKTLISKPQMDRYSTLGMFVESSKRSGAVYLFRRCRPTLVLLRTSGGNFRPSVALCLHPLAYYGHTFAGGMVPSDDVIAHLMLMRGDEHGFWKRANQHPIDRLEAGL